MTVAVSVEPDMRSPHIVAGPTSVAALVRPWEAPGRQGLCGGAS